MISLKGQDSFKLIIEFAICFCVLALFISIMLDFALYSRSEKVKKEKKSIVDTGTMTLFFFIFYAILRSGEGMVVISSLAVKRFLMIMGTTAIAAGCAANIVGRFNLGKNWANHVKIYEEHTLVRNGMYRIVRHPLYASIMLMFYGGVLIYRNVYAAAAVTFIFIPFMYYRARQEEHLLHKAFPEYSEYRKKTGMFFPKLIRRKEGRI